MALPKNTSKPKAPRRGSVKRASATLRSTSGAGFEFEDLISAWQLVKALSGEQAPGIGGVATQVQAQVSTLGWRIDDLLLTTQANTTSRRLAISAKGNLQVTAAGLPADFVTRAWEQWRDPLEPFSRIDDGLALVTIGTDPENLDGLNFLAGKTMNFANQAAMNGTILAHTDGNVPNLMVKIPEQTEFYLGELFYFFEFACGISGYVSGVNPFNQPGVESYKKNMFALLGKPGYEDAKAALEAKLK